jgi:hypothetical protein
LLLVAVDVHRFVGCESGMEAVAGEEEKEEDRWGEKEEDLPGKAV